MWIFLLLAGLFLVSGFLRGWRAGGGRRLCGLLGFALAIPAGWFSARWWPALLDGLLDYPDPVLAFVGGLAFGCLVFAAGALAGSLLFPKTHQVEGIGRRIKYGVSGAFLGLLWSVAFVILLAWLVMVGGNVAERALAFSQSEEASAAPSGDASNGTADNVSRAWVYLIRLNRSLALLPGYSWLVRLDPVPARTHRIMEKSALVLRDREALLRLGEHPRIHELMESPQFQEMATDAEVVELWEQRSIHALLSHPKVRAFTRNADIREKWGAVDAEALLDFALGEEGPTADPGRADPAPTSH